MGHCYTSILLPIFSMLLTVVRTLGPLFTTVLVALEVVDSGEVGHLH